MIVTVRDDFDKN